MDLRDVDPFGAEFLRDPYPWFRLLRDKAPCHFVEKRNMWMVTRYEDVVAVARNTAVFSSTGGVGYDWNQRPMMPMYDPPQHTRLRRLVSRPFQPGAVAAMTERIEATVDRLLTPMLERGTCELVADLALPLSLGVIADLIGVPEQRRGDLRRWSQNTVEDLAGGLTPEEAARVDVLRREFVTFLRELIAERRATPDASASDVISMILAANDEDKLTDKETLAFCVVLLVAGFETTVNAIANGVLALLAHPAECRRLVEQPELVPRLVEEVVRWDGPVLSFFRNTLVEAEVAGTKIPKGAKVQISFASANRDERRFPDPDAFRIDRSGTEHIGYGVGVHHCLGAPLARAQLASVARAMLRRVRTIELDGEAVRSASVLFRGAKSVPLRLTAR